MRTLFRSLLMGLIVLLSVNLILSFFTIKQPIKNEQEVHFCSAFFISSTGYIATAGHCEGVTYTAYYYDGSKYVPMPATFVAKDETNDVMILKSNIITDNYFDINTNYSKGESVTDVGWPNPYTFGFNLKINKGSIVKDVDHKIEMYIGIAPGSSGSAVVDANHTVVAVLVAGIPVPDGGMSYVGFGTPAKYLLDLMIKNGIVVLGPHKTDFYLSTVYLIVEG